MNPLNSKIWAIVSASPLVALLFPLTLFVEAQITNTAYDGYVIPFLCLPAIMLLGFWTLLFAFYTWTLKPRPKTVWFWPGSWVPFLLSCAAIFVVGNEISLVNAIWFLSGLIPFIALPVHWYFHFYSTNTAT